MVVRSNTFHRTVHDRVGGVVKYLSYHVAADAGVLAAFDFHFYCRYVFTYFAFLNSQRSNFIGFE